MLTMKIASMALAGLMTIGGTGFAASATELSTETLNTTPVSVMAMEKEAPTAPSISFNKEEKTESLLQKKAMIEERKIEFDENSKDFEEAKNAMQEKLIESGKTQEEIDNIMEKFTAKFAELKETKIGEMEIKQSEHEANIAERAEKGIVKGSKNAQLNLMV